MIYDRFTCPEPRLDPPEYDEPHCPVCGEVCETIYRQYGEIIGCSSCISSVPDYDLATVQCPNCGSVADAYYVIDATHEIVGCDQCVDVRDAWEML